MNNLCLGEGTVGRREGGVWRGFHAGLCRGKVKRHHPGVDWGRRLGASIGGRTSLLTQSRGMEAVSQENQKYNFLFGFNLLYKELLELNTFIILLSE